MKTTVDIVDVLLLEAKSLAHERGITLRDIMEDGLRLALDRMKNPTPFVLKDCSVGGEGLQPGQEDLSWEEVRAMIYGDRL